MVSFRFRSSHSARAPATTKPGGASAAARSNKRRFTPPVQRCSAKKCRNLSRRKRGAKEMTIKSHNKWLKESKGKGIIIEFYRETTGDLSDQKQLEKICQQIDSLSIKPLGHLRGFYELLAFHFGSAATYLQVSGRSSGRQTSPFPSTLE